MGGKARQCLSNAMPEARKRQIAPFLGKKIALFCNIKFYGLS